MTGDVLSVTLGRDDSGRAVVSWTSVGCQEVQIAWANTPDGTDHRVLCTVRADAGSLVLDQVPAPRPYILVSPVGAAAAIVAAERNLGLAGPRNFRDLGGYATADGRRTRWGQVFRSDALALDETDLEAFAALGIKTVYDLRSDEEREIAPNRLPTGSSIVTELVSLLSGSAPPPNLDALIRDGEAFLADVYLHMLGSSAKDFGRILSGLADSSRLPAVFHCAAGKDRTGMVAAILLSVLGVAEEDILDDYELTSTYRDPERVEAAVQRLRAAGGVAPEVLAGIVRTPRWAMKAALDQISDQHGGVDGYLTGAAAVEPSALEELRRLLVV